MPDRARRQKVELLCLEALTRDGPSRVAFLDAGCGGDTALRREVDELLAGESEAAAFLETPAWAESPALRTLRPGTRLGPYTIEGLIGAGGMGEVYLAEDTRLNRRVAIKRLPAEFAADTGRLARLEREARLLAQLEHPNIAALHALEDAAPDISGAPMRFLVMQLAEGETLKRRIEVAGRIPVDEALGIARQIAAALEAAHDKGVVHRDLKPANVVVDDDGRVKVVDFGIARSLGRTNPTTGHPSTLTVAGALLGTAAYMSPEQACGQDAQSTSDVWAFGCLLFEMLTGAPAFEANSAAALIGAILYRAPDFKRLPRGVPAGLRRLIRRCLQKSPDGRPLAGRALGEALARIETRRAGVGLASVLRRPRVAVPLAAAVIAAATISAALLARHRQITWVHRTALPQIEHLLGLGEEHLDPAFRLFLAAERVSPGIPEIEGLRPLATRRFFVATTPPGARVWAKGYRAMDTEWLDLGTTPIEAAVAPPGFLRFRIEKAGYTTLEAARLTGETGYAFTLWPEDEGPEGMVFVPGRFVTIGQEHTEAVFAGLRAETGDFWIDRHEVTNQRFKAFVDARGYERPELWRHPFVLEDGTELRWAGAMSRFTDATGRPGPATWEVGTFADGTGQHPVAGISWHEAAAYCALFDKELPTVYHWVRAAGIPDAAGRSLHEVALLGNSKEAVSGSEGPAPVGANEAISWNGAHDMSGNVREWVFNSDASGNRRYLFGGAWDDPTYLFWSHPDASSPWERTLRNGFRCASYAAKEGVRDPIVRQLRDYRREKPVSADVFAAYRMLYAYERRDLQVVVDEIDDSSPSYRKEVISFDAAYAGERVIAHLFLPTQAGSPPYQAVVYFPPLSAFVGGRAPSLSDTHYFRSVVLSGRAVMYPVYKGTHTRRDTSGLTESELRIRQFRDLARSLDYLQTRPDIDAGRVAFYGFSLGGSYGPIFTALEPRFAASILLAGGFMSDRPAPENDPFNFVTRSTVPTLMIQGRWDAIRPLESHTGPMFELLGTADEHKRLALLDGGHIVPLNPVIREVLDWLDRYLGPVSPPSGADPFKR
jgi:eukaryotic-like serine/threonine-protein kinase